MGSKANRRHDAGADVRHYFRPVSPPLRPGSADHDMRSWVLVPSLPSTKSVQIGRFLGRSLSPLAAEHRDGNIFGNAGRRNVASGRPYVSLSLVWETSGVGDRASRAVGS